MTPAVAEAGIWVATKIKKTLCFLHTLEKAVQHGADDYTGAIGLGARSSLLEEMTRLDEQKSKLALELGSALLNSVATTARATGLHAVETIQRHGDIVDAMMELESDTCFIVIGRKGRHHAEAFEALGSHIETLLRKAAQPVLIVPDRFTPPSSFMIAYDGRESADRALHKILEYRLLHGIACHLVTVKQNEPALQAKFAAAVNQLNDQGFQVTSAFLEGNIEDVLQRYQSDHHIDLVVMGAFGHSRLRQFFVGSHTLKMLEHTQVPLIILR